MATVTTKTVQISRNSENNQPYRVIISISVTSSILRKINGVTTGCRKVYQFLNAQYGGTLTVAEVAYLEKELDRRKSTDESAEVFIENWKQLSSQLGITRNTENDTRQLAKLIKLFERDNMYKTSIDMAYLNDKNLDETITLIIKEDQKDILKKKEISSVSFNNIADAQHNNITSILRVHDSNDYKMTNRSNSPYRYNNIDNTNKSNYSYSRNDRSRSRERSPNRNYKDYNNERNFPNKNYHNNNTNNNNKNSYSNNKRDRERSNSRNRSASNDNSREKKRFKYNAEKTSSNTNSNKKTHTENKSNNFKSDLSCWNFRSGYCKKTYSEVQ